MRAVATELGTSAMALYRYFANRDELEQAIVHHVLDTVDLNLPERSPWRERVALLMERLRDAITAHPAAVPLLLARRHTSPASLQWIESMLAVLSDAGFTGTDLVLAQRSLVSYLLGSLHTQHLGPLSGSGTAAMADLPETAFPNVTNAARQAPRISPIEEFRSGLAIVVRGLQPGTNHPTDG